MRRCLTRRYKFFCFVFVFIVLSLVHFFLIPSFTEQYNTDCYLADQSKESLEFLLRKIITSFEKHSVYYWLDFGSLLGAVRYHGIIPWDGDGDISFLRDDPHIHAALRDIVGDGVSANTMIASYKGMSVDFIRWTEDGDMYAKYYPPWVQDNIITKINHKFDTLPKSLIGNRKKINFLGLEASVPEQYRAVLKRRYRLTHWISVPFKWKCYVPCFMKTDKSCDN